MSLGLLNNRYRIVKKLGSGGFGNTMLAEDTYLPSGRYCVIKELKSLNNDPELFELAQQRFAKEASILELLGENHSQIPKLYAYFAENDQFYLVQEWVDGVTLTELVRQNGVLPEITVKAILVGLLGILNYIHGEGMIHRDIKPDNVILRAEDGQPVLIDFGAVKVSVNTNVSYSQLAQVSVVIGTPGYMSYEQGIGKPVFGSDLYSLGLTMIYLLTGKSPGSFSVDPLTNVLIWEHDLVNGISPNLKMVLDRSIQSHPSDRFKNVSQMLTALGLSKIVSGSVKVVGCSVNSQSPTKPLVFNHSLTRSKSGSWWLISILAAMAGGAVTMMVLLLYQGFSSNPSSVVSSDDAPIESSFPTPIGSASPTIIETPVVSPTVVDRIPAPRVVVITPSPSPTKSDLGAVKTESPVESGSLNPVATSSPSPSPSPSPSLVITASPSPSPSLVITASPSPSPSLVITASPSPSLGVVSPSLSPSPSPSPSLSIDGRVKTFVIPTFGVGTSRAKVQEVLGRPYRDVRGQWNTRAVIYKLVSNRVDLGYLFDRRSGVLVQTEVSFEKSVDYRVMNDAIDGLLNGRGNNEIKAAVKQIQQGLMRDYTFRVGNLKGQIVAQDCDFVYISIWDADLHDFNVEASRSCL